ncbi:glycosyl hydrolase family 28 protein [Actinopolymorpha sp. B11F2]|uniref:glycosyl hydrolase family 28 protein n=1 Tax=Actinopolymorpha sp. B11F2 TaxID=3160862 RepID=UPI0032E3A68E
MIIRDCLIIAGDDDIAFKAGKDADGRRVDAPCEYCLVEDCVMEDGNGGVTVGSETTGGVRYIFARNCRMSSPNLGRPIRVKTNPNRGGRVEQLYFRNFTVGEADDSAVEVALDYANVTEGSYYPTVRDIEIDNVMVQSAERALYLIGNVGNPIRDVRLSNCEFIAMAEPDIIRHVEGLKLKNVTNGGVPY